MSLMQRCLSSWSAASKLSTFAILCGLCISMATLSYVSLPETIESIAVKQSALSLQKEPTNGRHFVKLPEVSGLGLPLQKEPTDGRPNVKSTEVKGLGLPLQKEPTNGRPNVKSTEVKGLGLPSQKEPTNGRPNVKSTEVKQSSIKEDQTNCSNDVLRSFYKTYHAFPESGVWLKGLKNGNHDIFVPSICKFGNCDVFNMLREKGITYILFLGDSQGHKSFIGMSNYLSGSPNVNCTGLIQSRRGRFFSQDGVLLKTVENGTKEICSSCHVATFLCKQHTYTYTVKMEYFGLYSWTEAVNVSGHPGIPTFQGPFVEYIFKYYLHNNCPELLVVFPLFNHLKGEVNVTKSEFVHHFKPFRNLLQSTLPQTTWVQWLTTPMEFEEARRGAAEKFKGLRYDGYLAGEVMILFSRWMYEALSDILIMPNSRHLGFFNVANMTASLVNRSRDGVHLDKRWYDEWMAYVFETMCHGL